MKLICCYLAIFCMNAFAADTKIYQQDALGNTLHNKPSYVVQDNGHIIETDTIGNKRYNKQQYQMKDGKIYQTDSLGNIQYNKPQFVINSKP